MQFTERNINNRMVRFVMFQLNKKCHFEYIVEEIRRKNVYFDYIVVYIRKPARNNMIKTVKYILDNNFKMIDSKKYGDFSEYASHEYIITEYEKHPDYLKYKRENKLERILNE